MLLSGEVFFRNCEAFANGAISRDMYGQYHNKSIELIQALVKTKQQAAKATTVAAEAANKEAEAKRLKAEKALQETMAATSTFLQQSQIKRITDDLVKCKVDNAGDETKLKACDETFETEYKKITETY